MDSCLRQLRVRPPTAVIVQVTKHKSGLNSDDISHDQTVPARGDAKSLRTAEISNWTGKAIAAPRTELDELLQREELDKAGIYILTGADPESGLPSAYIGEAEVIRDRLKQHKTKDFWISAIVFVQQGREPHQSPCEIPGEQAPQ